ncbi:Type II/IV secretion system ATP hydrolase TadA/VirB11/CpaF, TadA subfamily [Labilithrix luteola]|uniref:Type II/IV secretion system ATP hydrolase TadA/VirB11/CpaF, TadA subfamily n=1 Tax=Labilithrix luteola TaxID=1391654 RepID=A0A0K1PKM3_9BACT|nr:ATPase, T2SS/T4P/T4SS family [Labilithrix luteola]AKU94075.1 Type II/IV secretion system ATP hydrolase TadA/VirB11/CpaF, TadA subfamily [Labilithrix luteola]
MIAAVAGSASFDVEVVLQSSTGTRRSVRLRPEGAFTVGRDERCAVSIDSRFVSRTHIVVRPGERTMRVEDVSSNGTLAGDMILRRTAAELAYGTPIVVGDHTVTVMLQSPIASGVSTVVSPTPQPATSPSERTPLPAHSMRTSRMPAHAPIATIPPTLPTESVIVLPASDLVVDEEGQSEGFGTVPADVRREIHRQLLELLDLAKMDATKVDDPSMRPKVLTAIRRIVHNLGSRLPAGTDNDRLIGEMADEALGLGPLERFLGDATISEVMVLDANTIYVEKNGKVILTDARFTDDERVRAVIERIVTPLGRRIDESSPLVDARLKDGSRVNAVIRPLALRGSCITIRKFARTPLTVERLIEFGAMNERMARFLMRSVVAKKNVVISGGTGSGKTTLLNVLSGAIPSEERIVTIEDAAELQLKQPHVVSLETRPANIEGKGEYTIRDLVKNALRMRPDRIVVGECRGGEALDMLQAMNTGHDGSLTTTHANSPVEAVARLETLCLMAGLDLPVKAIREQIAGSVDLIVQQTRFSDGSRRVSSVAEVTGLNDDGEVSLRPIFEFVRTGTGPNGKIEGAFRATGYLPSFLDTFIVMGLIRSGEAYL